MKVTFEPHTKKDCLYDDCLLLVDGVPYKVTYCILCGRIQNIVYSKGDHSRFINKHKGLKMFML